MVDVCTTFLVASSPDKFHIVLHRVMTVVTVRTRDRVRAAIGAFVQRFIVIRILAVLGGSIGVMCV